MFQKEHHLLDLFRGQLVEFLFDPVVQPVDVVEKVAAFSLVASFARVCQLVVDSSPMIELQNCA